MATRWFRNSPGQRLNHFSSGASLEHKLRYKKDIPEDQAQQLQEELLACATQSAQLDERMQEIRNQLVSKFGE